MKTLHIIIVILIFTGCKTEYKEVVEVYKNGNPKDVRIYENKNNKKDYRMVRYFENGQAQFQGTVKNEKFIGEKLNYYNNGKLKQVDSLIKPCDLDFCCCDGKVTRFDTSGKITEDYENRNGIENGLVRTYDKNGKLKDSYYMTNGKKNGIARRYFDNGKMQSIVEYENDLVKGVEILFNKKGDTTAVFYYEDHINQFPMKFWKDGNIKLYGNLIPKSNKVLWMWKNDKGIELKRKWAVFSDTLSIPE